MTALRLLKLTLSQLILQQNDLFPQLIIFLLEMIRLNDRRRLLQSQPLHLYSVRIPDRSTLRQNLTQRKVIELIHQVLPIR